MTKWIAKLIAVKLFGILHYTYFPTHLMASITRVADGTEYNWFGYMQARMRTNLTKVANSTKQASFFMPTIFTGLLLHKFREIRLPVPQGILEFPNLQVWTKVYKCGIASSEHAAIMVTYLQLAMKLLTTEIEEVAEGEKVQPLVTNPPHGQGLESRQIEDVEEKPRKKGKFPMIEEVAVHVEPEVRPQPSPMIRIPTRSNQVQSHHFQSI
eukprot:Gb_25858 [translate_table: standard]